MKSKLLFYLFVFSVLILIFQIVNSNRVMQDQQARLIEKEEKIQTLQDRFKILQSDYNQQVFFKLKDSPDFRKLYGNSNIDSLQGVIEGKLFSFNGSGKKLNAILLEKEGKFFVEKVKLLNHKWMIVLYSNGSRKEEAILSYAINANDQLILNRWVP